MRSFRASNTHQQGRGAQAPCAAAQTLSRLPPFTPSPPPSLTKTSLASTTNFPLQSARALKGSTQFPGLSPHLIRDRRLLILYRRGFMPHPPKKNFCFCIPASTPHPGNIDFTPTPQGCALWKSGWPLLLLLLLLLLGGGRRGVLGTPDHSLL